MWIVINQPNKVLKEMAWECKELKLLNKNVDEINIEKLTSQFLK